VLGRFGRIDPAVPPENLRDRAGGRHILVSPILQEPPDLAAAPGRMILANRQDQLLQRFRRRSMESPRPARPILQTLLRIGGQPPQPLVAGLATDAEPLAQLADIGVLGTSQGYKLLT
jgi:hypothetical protein